MKFETVLIRIPKHSSFSNKSHLTDGVKQVKTLRNERIQNPLRRTRTQLQFKLSPLKVVYHEISLSVEWIHWQQEVLNVDCSLLTGQSLSNVWRVPILSKCLPTIRREGSKKEEKGLVLLVQDTLVLCTVLTLARRKKHQIRSTFLQGLPVRFLVAVVDVSEWLQTKGLSKMKAWYLKWPRAKLNFRSLNSWTRWKMYDQETPRGKCFSDV